jgi:hypothetical protein
MELCNTHVVNIFIGLRSGYTEKVFPVKVAYDICQKFCDTVKCGLTFTETQFIYVEGNEPGLIIGFINYPRFPSVPSSIESKAKDLAKLLMVELEQERCSIVCPTLTYMIEKSDLN